MININGKNVPDLTLNSFDPLLTFTGSKQRSDGALMPNGDEQCPRQHDQHNGDDVSSLRHLQGQT